ncbi:MAG: IS1 family transposase [Candidatus Poribacteria bacterium]|nr:IS1 family transposase [Candidatus Poribacteria bacterium]
MKYGISQSKKRELWVWIAIDRLDQEVIAYTVGGRSKKTWKRLLRLLNRYRIVQMATDGFNVYKQIVSVEHIIGKKHTTQIESLNANIRRYLARFRRRTRCYSKCPIMVDLSLALLFYQKALSILF